MLLVRSSSRATLATPFRAVKDKLLMPYLIDGHNLIGQLTDIALNDPDDEAKLVQRLMSFAARKKVKCVVVFDHGLPGGKSRMSTRGVEVIFAPQHGNADRVIKARIDKITDAKGWFVVSNDNEVLDAARARKMGAIKSRDFAPELDPLGTKTPKRKARRLEEDAGAAHDVRLSPAEVEAWLKLFKDHAEAQPQPTLKKKR